MRVVGGPWSAALRGTSEGAALLRYSLEIRAKFVLLGGIIISALGAVFVVGPIAHLAHLGGFIGGLAVALALQRNFRLSTR